MDLSILNNGTVKEAATRSGAYKNYQYDHVHLHSLLSNSDSRSFFFLPFLWETSLS